MKTFIHLDIALKGTREKLYASENGLKWFLLAQGLQSDYINKKVTIPDHSQYANTCKMSQMEWYIIGLKQHQKVCNGYTTH